jgi:hypothetical protein
MERNVYGKGVYKGHEKVDSDGEEVDSDGEEVDSDGEEVDSEDTIADFLETWKESSGAEEKDDWLLTGNDQAIEKMLKEEEAMEAKTRLEWAKYTLKKQAELEKHWKAIYDSEVRHRTQKTERERERKREKERERERNKLKKKTEEKKQLLEENGRLREENGRLRNLLKDTFAPIINEQKLTYDHWHRLMARAENFDINWLKAGRKRRRKTKRKRMRKRRRKTRKR